MSLPSQFVHPVHMANNDNDATWPMWTIEAWRAEAERRFGAPGSWRFVCPRCRRVGLDSLSCSSCNCTADEENGPAIVALTGPRFGAVYVFRFADGADRERVPYETLGQWVESSTEPSR